MLYYPVREEDVLCCVRVKQTMRGAELSSERRRFALLYEKTYGERFCVKQWEKKIHYVEDKTCGWIFMCYPLREEDMLSWLRIRTRSISMVSKPSVFEVFVVKSAQ